MPYARGSNVGHLYPTARDARCTSYKPCAMCTKCRNYNPADAGCTFCESRLRNWRGCNHDESLIRKLEHKFGEPMFHPNQRTGTVTLAETAGDKEMHDLLGKFNNQVTVEKDTPGFVPGIGEFEELQSWTGSG